MQSFPVSPEKAAALQKAMAELGIAESDLEEQFIRGSGPGGQKINKTSICVRLTHRPSGLEVRCQASRSQAMNRFLARRLLCEQIAGRRQGEKSRAQQNREKIRRQKRRRSRRAKAKMLDDKSKQGSKKALRQKISNHES